MTNELRPYQRQALEVLRNEKRMIVNSKQCGKTAALQALAKMDYSEIEKRILAALEDGEECFVLDSAAMLVGDNLFGELDADYLLEHADGKMSSVEFRRLYQQDFEPVAPAEEPPHRRPFGMPDHLREDHPRSAGRRNGRPRYRNTHGSQYRTK